MGGAACRTGSGPQPGPRAAPHAGSRARSVDGPAYELLPAQAPDPRPGVRAFPPRVSRPGRDHRGGGMRTHVADHATRRPARLLVRGAGRRHGRGDDARRRPRRSLPSAPWIPQGAMGTAGGRRSQSRGRVGICAIASRRCGGVRAPPRVPYPTRRVRAAGRHESDGGRPVSLVVSAARRRGQSPRRRLLHSHGAVFDPSDPLGPFWMVFNTEGSFQALDSYLGRTPQFDELLVTLFSHGVDSIGLVPIGKWRSLFPRALQRGDFIGVDEASFPRDFAVFVRYHFDYLRKIPARHPSPPVLTLDELNEFLAQTRDRYRIAWLDLKTR